MSRSVKWLLAAIGVLMFWTFYSYDRPSSKENLHRDNIKKPHLVSANQRTNSEIKNRLQSTHVAIDEENVLINELDEWLKQIKARRYSNDPIVEIASLVMEYESCDYNSQWQMTDKELTVKQSRLKVLVENHCDQLLEKYPSLGKKRTVTEELFKQLSPVTTLGNFLQTHQIAFRERVYPVELSKKLLPLAMQEQNAQMIYMANWFNQFETKNRLFDEQIIKAEQYEYLRTIQAIALTDLSCEFQNDITCSPDSRFMQHKCFQEEQFCGLDFDTWYELTVTPGMDADIQILQQHFLGLAQR